jgi:hypothetical protein
MKTRTIVIILVLMIVGVSCIPSLYPLYRKKDLLFDERLVGKFDVYDGFWIFDILDLNDPLDQGVWWERFKSGKTYRLTVFEGDKEAKFAVHLIMLKNNYYLDFFPVTYSIEHSTLDAHLFPAHIFAKLEFAGDDLVIHWFDGEFLNDLIDSNKIKISYKELGHTLLLTAKTDEIQNFVKKYGDDPRAYVEAEDPDTLYRMNN